MASARKKIVTKRSVKYSPSRLLILLSIGLTLLCLGAYRLYQQTILSFAQSPPLVSPLSFDKASSPIHIRMASISLNLAITEASITNGLWEISPDGASHLASSARPGETGNIVIYGHNKKALFGQLRDTQMGDKIILTTEDGRIHRYSITEIKTVKPTDIEVILPTSYETLTVYTCAGFLDSLRLIIRAMPVTV